MYYACAHTCAMNGQIYDENDEKNVGMDQKYNYESQGYSGFHIERPASVENLHDKEFIFVLLLF